MSNETVVACLDIGGSSIKSALVTRQGALIDGSHHVDAVDANGTAEAILGAFSGSLARLLEQADATDLNLAGVGVAICGPFDYESGISKITGVDKYEAIYDMNVKEHLRSELALPTSLPVIFDVDAWSFGRGEVWAGAGKGYDRVIIFTFGTGVGSAFSVDGRIIDEGPGVPWIGWISGQSYRDGILNDYISSVAMLKQYRVLTGEAVDVREMAERARVGDTHARQIFQEMGETLGEFVRVHHLYQFKPDSVVFGGQMSRSADLFMEPFSRALGAPETGIVVTIAQDIERSALRGAAKLVFDTI